MFHFTFFFKRQIFIYECIDCLQKIFIFIFIFCKQKKKKKKICSFVVPVKGSSHSICSIYYLSLTKIEKRNSNFSSFYQKNNKFICIDGYLICKEKETETKNRENFFLSAGENRKLHSLSRVTICFVYGLIEN